MSGSTDQLPRLLSLVPYLLTRPGARMADVARTFGVSEEQIARDLSLVYMCGLPGYFPGDLIEVDITASGRITVSNADPMSRPLRLSRDEALPLIVGLRMLADLPGLQDRDAVDSALAKLEDAAGDVAAIASIAVDVDPARGSAEVLAVVHRGLAEKRRLHLSYYVPARDETTERDVDPMRVSIVEGRSYLEGYCRVAEAVRLFRLDRITAASVLDVPADPPADAQPRDLDAGLFQAGPSDLRVVLEVGPAGRWVSEYYPCESVEPLPDGGARLELRTPDTRWVRRLALRLGSQGRVVEPPDLVDAVTADAKAAVASYVAAGLPD
ncbi:MAG: proteasome accessory factor [Actinomycetota bacterium]|jgi:proteasome accessory factor C|nr:proteasome accessory factor [Actinomycetota bacterium]